MVELLRSRRDHHKAFFGRRKELDQLHELCDQFFGVDENEVDGHTVQKQRAGSMDQAGGDDDDGVGGARLPVALIWGVSGSGKSRLAHQFFHELEMKADRRGRRQGCRKPAGVGEDGVVCGDDVTGQKTAAGTTTEATTATTVSSKTGSSSGSASPHSSAVIKPASATSAVKAETDTNGRDHDHRQGRRHHYIIRGKCDELVGSNSPFSVIVQALTDFAAQLRREPHDEVERIRQRVTGSLGNDTMAFLVSLVPALNALLLHPGRTGGSSSQTSVAAGTDRDDQSSALGSSSAWAMDDLLSMLLANQQHHGTNTEQVWNKLQYAFTKFMSAISTPERPILVFLDDLQWASKVSLDLLASLVLDTNTVRNLFLIGTVRQEVNPHTNEVLEVLSTSALSGFCEQLASRCSVTNQRNAAKEGRGERAGKSRSLQHITLSDMTQAETRQWLSRTLQQSTDEAAALSDRLHAKTSGNMFNLVQALEELQRNDVLVYDDSKQCWRLTVDAAGDLALSDNVLGSIVAKVRQLPEELQQMLTVASYIRSSFDIRVLKAVLENEAAVSSSRHPDRRKHLFDLPVASLAIESISQHLETAVMEGLLTNQIGGTHYTFFHDRIQQAMQTFVEYGSVRDDLRKRIGFFLLQQWRMRHLGRSGGDDDDVDDEIAHHGGALMRQRSLRGAGSAGTHGHPHQDHQDDANGTNKSAPALLIDDGLLFVAASSLNKAKGVSPLFLAKMNLDVGERASQIAALTSASDFLEKSAEALRKSVPQPWKDQYELCHRLWTTRADVELSLGNFELGEKLAHDVINANHASTIDHKMSTYLATTKALSRQGRHFEAQKMAKAAPLLLGEYPKRGFLRHIVMDMIRIKSYLRRHSDDDIMSLPTKQDPKLIIAMKLLFIMTTESFATKNSIEWTLGMCRMMRMTFKHGLCESSAAAFSMYSVVASESSDQDAA
eukprot:CAMPEP_0119546322 /NCGR_PEP_ID=MMETSP1352-20130426/799_1 /TAXON_ID=265584 /ORGANISM="Stauroneis constricta, Strain CCMP1120" /LENGTH=948 /DNA_ID=CAMNT_0007591017 /DNA_START=42 /DNA_END=2884 /DNA_ORIENTATION=-